MEQTLAVCRAFHEADQGHTANLAERAATDATGAAVGNLAQKAQMLSKRIAELAAGGNQAAVRELFQIAIEATKALNDLPLEHVRPVARLCSHWPLVDSPHKHRAADRDGIWKQLQVASDWPEDWHSGSGAVCDRGNEIARSLFHFILRAKGARRCWPYPVRLGKQIDALPVIFDKDTAREWWKIASLIFKATYPEPHKIPDFIEMIRAESRHKYPSRLKSAIVSKIEESFFAIAPK